MKVKINNNTIELKRSLTSKESIIFVNGKINQILGNGLNVLEEFERFCGSIALNEALKRG